MTIAIVGRCAKTNMAGVAITTSSIAVGSRCPYAMAGAGAVTTQNVTDPTIGPEVLGLMAKGHDAATAIKTVMADRPHADYRQVAAVDLHGGTGVFTGQEILGNNAVNQGRDCVGAGNLLSRVEVIPAMTDAFEQGHDLHLAERLTRALIAALDAGGEEGPTHSAALIVAHERPWPLVDLRIDWTDDCPGQMLLNLWENYKPQMNDYLTRAIDPSAAPSYGVPGDE
jgi:uncharacterized Ntn-hydrolase superfamily protein